MFMKINIASSHRFHLLDLARELEKQGHDVRFYSYIPPKRCRHFGLATKYCHSFTWIAVLFILFGKILPQNLNYYRNILIDYYVGLFMRPCDVFICLGSVYYFSIKRAKRKFRATAILEWGSKHIIEQVKQFGTLDSYPQKSLKRELAEYEIVDYISIAADHVKQSFLQHGLPESKLLVNPYGVNLENFHPTILSGDFDIITVGGWRYEKGSDLLVEVCRKYHYRLLHVGALVNMNFPDEDNFHHVDPVDEKQLINYYSKAKIFVLPSRAEGLALVQAQAIACGLPVVCSKDTGGRDLACLLSDKKWVIETKDSSIEELNRCIKEALILSNSGSEERNYAKADISEFSWEAYGRRYNENLHVVMNKR